MIRTWYSIKYHDVHRSCGKSYVTEACIRCKYMDCVEVCPVDCFHEGDNMLVIDPGVCIHCGVCVPECPADAIKRDDEPNMERWLLLNAEYARLWPVLARKGEPPPDAKLWDQEPDKFERFFSSAPGQGS